MAVRKRMEPQTGFAEIAERRRREQAVRETHEPLLPSSSAPRLMVSIVHGPLCALLSGLIMSKESGRRCRRHCCVGVNGIARTTMSLIAMRSHVRAVRI
jgi:hypothetical protein